MTSALPLVTIAVVAHEDEASIDAVLRAAVTQDYPAGKLEVLVADAMSMDATREIILRYAREDERVRLVDNPDRTRAAGLNAIVRRARGEIIVPMDPGGDYARTHVGKCVDALSTSPAEHVTILPRSAGRTLKARALSAAQGTRLAFASSAELTRGQEAVPALIGAIRRRVFAKVGLFDAAAKMEEEEDLSRRIAATGGGVTVRKDIVVHRADVGSFRDLFLRHYGLGRGRARRTVKERRVGRARDLVPLALVVGGGALAATSSVQPLTPLAAGAYALVTGAEAVRVGRSEGLATIPIAWAAYPVMHLAHGVGFGAGVVRALVSPDWSAAELLDADAVSTST